MPAQRQCVLRRRPTASATGAEWTRSCDQPSTGQGSTHCCRAIRSSANRHVRPQPHTTVNTPTRRESMTTALTHVATARPAISRDRPSHRPAGLRTAHRSGSTKSERPRLVVAGMLAGQPLCADRPTGNQMLPYADQGSTNRLTIQSAKTIPPGFCRVERVVEFHQVTVYSHRQQSQGGGREAASEVRE